MTKYEWLKSLDKDGFASFLANEIGLHLFSACRVSIGFEFSEEDKERVYVTLHDAYANCMDDIIDEKHPVEVEQGCKEKVKKCVEKIELEAKSLLASETEFAKGAGDGMMRAVEILKEGMGNV